MTQHSDKIETIDAKGPGSKFDGPGTSVNLKKTDTTSRPRNYAGLSSMNGTKKRSVRGSEKPEHVLAGRSMSFIL